MQLTQEGVGHDAEDCGDSDDTDLKAVDDLGHGSHTARRDHI